MKTITIAVPTYKAKSTLPTLLASVLTQSLVNDVSIIFANDWPEDNNSYDFLKSLYPTLDITILPCDKNTGPGLARQRALDACKTDWITFIDADDVFINPFALEFLYNNITPNCVEVQGAFYQEVAEGNIGAAVKTQLVQNNQPIPPRMMPRNDIGHPWVFGRLYNVQFLRAQGIGFSQLRAMEDGEFNWKIRMTIEGSPLQINLIEDPIYLWKTGSDHSITRIGLEENEGVPLYNWDLCQVGATAAAINAIHFCKKKNPFNGGVTRFAVEQMISQYFTYVKCLDEKPIFAKQNLFNAKRFYHNCYKDIEKNIDDEILKTMYTAQYAAQSQEMIGLIPEITFFEFMNKVRTDEYGGKEEFDEIRKELPDWVIELDKKSGVLGEEGYVYTDNEMEDN
ncbi:glycosyltransferase family 2 protein [Dialister succinatiphilus]|uniref:glycosyltransferase family 2 protein n=1 Tax=Dialister succinatiphilus TaxID=487173 RepID=UPI004027EB54